MERIIGITILVFFVWIIVAASACIQTENYCVERGWREGIVTFSFKRMCASRIEQTDVVVPIEKAYQR